MTLLDLARRGMPLDGLDIVDVHGHIGGYSFGIPDRSEESLVAQMDRIGVRQIIVSHTRCMSDDVAWGNRQVLAAMRRFPGRILGYASLFPFDAEAVRAEAEACIAAGMAGFKIHNATGFAYDHAAFVPAYEMADRRRLPVLVHTWGDRPVIAVLERLADRYPGMSLLLAHAGVQDPALYIEAARRHPNVHLDLAYSRAPTGLVERLAGEAGADRLVWGSDCWFFSQAHQIGKVLGAALSDDEKRRILGANARALLARAIPQTPPQACMPPSTNTALP